MTRKPTIHQRTLRALLLVALLATALPATGNATLAGVVTITGVDNYGGSSNVTTDRPNTTVKITQLDADKKPVRSWTGTTDANGRITIAAGSNLSQEYLRAEEVKGDREAEDFEDPSGSRELVAPTVLVQGQAFTFAAMGTVNGEVIRVETVDGVVVAEREPDRYDRVFLARGLDAGSYLVRAQRPDRDGGTIVLPQRLVVSAPTQPQPVVPADGSPLRPWQPTPALEDTERVGLELMELQLMDSARYLRSGERATLEGRGFGADASALAVTVGGADVPALAATDAELVLAPIEGIEAGVHDLRVRNEATGLETKAAPVLVYDLEVKLRDNTIRAGGDTVLDVRFKPERYDAKFRADVVSGPVDLGRGRTSKEIETRAGKGELTVHAAPGSRGPFQLAWTLQQVSWEPPQDGGEECIGDDCACTCRLAISGPDVIYRHWDPAVIVTDRERYLGWVCFEADPSWTCTPNARPPLYDEQCTIDWTLPEGWRKEQTSGGLLRICLGQPPKTIFDGLKAKGQVDTRIAATADCPYRCGTLDASGDNTFEQRMTCSAEKKLTFRSCASKEDATAAAADCERRKRELAAAAAAARAATSSAAAARGALETGVNVFGSTLHTACQGLPQLQSECTWASGLYWTGALLSAAHDVLGAVAMWGTGGTSEAVIMAEEQIIEWVVEEMLFDQPAGDALQQCDQLLANAYNRLINLKVKACEGASGFHQVVAGLRRARVALRQAISRAKDHDGCAPCDLGAELADAERALAELDAELARCTAADARYGAWIDYCDGNPAYTTAGAAAICTDIPPVP
jgi:hypothetical protein